MDLSWNSGLHEGTKSILVVADLGRAPLVWFVDGADARLASPPYLAQAILTVFPRREVVTPDVSDTTLRSVNALILKAFVQSATSEGSIPFLGCFPENNVEIDELSRPLTLGKKVLQEVERAYIDLTPCVGPLNHAERFGKYAHYSPESNARVAECWSKAVRQALAMPPD